jgi:hypothetical protein
MYEVRGAGREKQGWKVLGSSATFYMPHCGNYREGEEKVLSRYLRFGEGD